jgi:hypothetical protein
MKHGLFFNIQTVKARGSSPSRNTGIAPKRRIKGQFMNTSTFDSQLCSTRNSSEYETDQTELGALLDLQKRWVEEFQILVDYWKQPVKPIPTSVRIAAAFIGSVFEFSDDWINDRGCMIDA